MHANVRTLRGQHGDATSMIERLTEGARCYRGGNDAKLLAVQIGKLARLLRLHFAQEDCTLYAPLLASLDREVARVASDYFEDFHGLAERLDLFAIRWCSADAIAGRFGLFREELTAISDALARRIMLEEAYLYPLLEAEVRKAA